ncbi:MAG TPA: TonB-dependent receptor [Acidobacteriaceae bacterium]|jgi:iron complex outermembrane receptor protein|nr:TonB-dependent receptor [Acidobacteriaceae bacterium]
MNISVTLCRSAVAAFLCLIALTAGTSQLQAQNTTGALQGSVVDPGGKPFSGAVVVATNDVQVNRSAFSGPDGKFSIAGLPAGIYSIQISATGFAPQVHDGVVIPAGSAANLAVSLKIGSVSEEVRVEAEADTSLASQLSPVKSVLDAGSARTEITSEYVREFTSPVTDFADITQAAPGTVSYSENGIGLGQAKIYFRGFVDDDYTMTWDGIPFNDANDPSHHSWAYVPAPAIGYVDFDRSPGTASDMGPSNFGGSIHLFSPKLPDTMDMKVSESYGSFNTNQILGAFDSGLFGGKNPKANFWFEGHHMSSDGYQTENFQQRTAGTAKYTYKFDDSSYLSLIGTVVIVDSNTPNNDPARSQIAQYGDNFLMQSNEFNSDGSYNGLYYRWYTYHVPTNFEIVNYTADYAHGWRLETKPYTYSYSNHQHYNKNQVAGSVASEAVTSKSAIDKMNQYNRVGNITQMSQASKYGVLRFGAWYELTPTNRYQIQSDPRTWQHVAGTAGINFHENFTITTVQPFVEYQLVAIPRWTITAGIKDAYFNMWLKQFADNGKIVGSLGGAPFAVHDAGYNNWLPSVEANFRIRSNWSAYGQYGRGSIIPFSSVFDVTGAQVAVTPPPTVATTYQGGTVLKLNRVSMDADAYHIHFVNQYSSFTPSSGPNTGFTYYYATPPSDTNGVEGEGNIAFGAGLGLFLNGTFGQAKYESSSGTGATATNPAVPASPSSWVALAPHDTESVGLTYQRKDWDLGFFNKRVGDRWEDDGAYHQTVPLDPFWMNNLFLNYTLRHGSKFDDSKIKLSFNNLFDFHDITDIGAANAVTASNVLYTPNGSDTTQLLPGRSVMVTLQLGFTPKER